MSTALSEAFERNGITKADAEFDIAIAKYLNAGGTISGALSRIEVASRRTGLSTPRPLVSPTRSAPVCVSSEIKREVRKTDPTGALRQRVRRRRVKEGIKVITAEFNPLSGSIHILSKEAPNFSHIRINGRSLAEVTTDEALLWCEQNRSSSRFVEAICRRIADPRRPIGEQITSGIVREAVGFAESSEGEWGNMQ